MTWVTSKLPCKKKITQNKVTIKSDGGLSDEDIEKMIKEAEANAESDKKIKDLVDAKNEAESLIHSAEKSLKDYAEKISDDLKNDINAEISSLKELSNTDDIDGIKQKADSLREKLMKIGSSIYGDNQSNAATEGNENVKDV